jgi:hypothetical protein
MKHYNFKRRSLFSGPHLLGLLFVAAGIFSIISPAIIKSDSSLERAIYIGTAAIILGTIIVSAYGGTVIDFNKKRVKDYFSVLGYQFGEWIALPTVERIAVNPVNSVASNTPNGISPTWSGNMTYYKVFLYSDNSKLKFSFEFSDEERAVKTAKLLSEKLDAVYELRTI